VISYRRATAFDVDAIAQVHVQSSRETYAPIFGGANPRSPALEQRRKLWTGIQGTADPVFVALESDAIVGFCHGQGATMTMLYLLASHHRRGIGREVMSRLRAALAESGATEITFNVLAKNTNAIAFYQSQGAREVGREVVEEPEGPTEDIVFAVSTA
jgi:ribosomal protein S18 acetylase RimI-like enzyme